MHQFIEVAAVVSSAIYGVLLARQHNMDFVGVFSLAFIVAFGGGTLRDLFLDRHPLFWIREYHYTIIVFAISLLTSVVWRIPQKTEELLEIPDALGLGLFSIAGTTAAIDSGTSLFVASLLGVVTGTFGGVVGDVICNRIPTLFRPAPLFAICSFVGCWAHIALCNIAAVSNYSAPISIAIIVILRLLAVRFNWRLPNLGSDPRKDNFDQHHSK